MPVIRIERALQSDARQMAALESSWHLPALPDGAMAETGALYRMLGEARLAELARSPHAICLVARGEEGLVGIAVSYRKPLAIEIYPHLSQDYAPSDSVWIGDFTYVKTVAVQAAKLGQGVGSSLLRSLRAEIAAAGCPYAVASISVSPHENIRSIRLFRSVLKAEEIGRHEASESGITCGLFKSQQLSLR